MKGDVQIRYCLQRSLRLCHEFGFLPNFYHRARIRRRAATLAAVERGGHKSAPGRPKRIEPPWGAATRAAAERGGYTYSSFRKCLR